MTDADQSASLLLIIDADPGSLELLSNALARPGLEILTATSSEDGLDLFCSRRPEIVITELMMPHMGGMQVLEQIVETDPATHVILMTAHYSTESAVEAIKKGASDYWNKPVSLGLVLEQIGQLIEETRKRKRSQQLEDELRTNFRIRGNRRLQPADIRNVVTRPARGAILPHGAHRRGDRHGEGLGGPRASSA